MTYLLSRPALVVSATLLAFIGGDLALRGQERPISQSPLAGFTLPDQRWTAGPDAALDQESGELLKADDTLSRIYRAADGGSVGLFVAFFKSQRAGIAPHSPKVCLPGTGWAAEESSTISIPIPGRSEPITVNRYRIRSSNRVNQVYYWYQTPHRVIASEYMARFYLVADSLRYHRSDTWLVRVAVDEPLGGALQAQQQAVQFIQAAFAPLTEFMPQDPPGNSGI